MSHSLINLAPNHKDAWASGSIALLFLTSALDVSAQFTPLPFYLWDLLDWKMVRNQSRVVEKSALSLSGIEPLSPQTFRVPTSVTAVLYEESCVIISKVTYKTKTEITSEIFHIK